MNQKAEDWEDWDNAEWDVADQELFWKKFRRSHARKYSIRRARARPRRRRSVAADLRRPR